MHGIFFLLISVLLSQAYHAIIFNLEFIKNEPESEYALMIDGISKKDSEANFDLNSFDKKGDLNAEIQPNHRSSILFDIVDPETLDVDHNFSEEGSVHENALKMKSDLRTDKNGSPSSTVKKEDEFEEDSYRISKDSELVWAAATFLITAIVIGWVINQKIKERKKRYYIIH